MDSYTAGYPYNFKLDMEHTEGTIGTKITQHTVYPQEYQQASNSYLMSVVAVMAGLPLPIINVLASFGYYLAYRKSSYFVRWHCIQATLAQLIMLPFNSFLFWWTVSIIFSNDAVSFRDIERHTYYEHHVTLMDLFTSATLYYWLYLSLVLFFNLIEFFSVIYTAIHVKKGHNVRWFLISNITDMLCSKEDRDPYRI